MITLVEALNYRCLAYVQRPLQPFHVLVGPNASGKTTFLDVIGFLRDLISDGLDAAIETRTPNPEELLFRRQGDRWELAVEAQIPDVKREMTQRPYLDRVRYEVAIGRDETGHGFEFKGERLLFKKDTKAETQRSSFPKPSGAPVSLITPSRAANTKSIINKVPGGNDNSYSETHKRAGRGWAPSLRLGPHRSAFGNIPADEESFPVATWFKDHLSSGVQKFDLNSFAIRRPSPPTRVSGFLPDGSNLPWVIARLRKDNLRKHQAWIRHMATALPDLMDITTIERPEDKHRYMVYKYAGGMEIPSWLVSDGTLRLTALTLPAYLPESQAIYLVEEPENGIHPKAVATAFDSLSSVYGSQVLLATHSPVVLNAAQRDQVLCFAKDENGATDIVLGSEHPALQRWQDQASLGTLLAMGVLG